MLLRHLQREAQNWKWDGMSMSMTTIQCIPPLPKYGFSLLATLYFIEVYS